MKLASYLDPETCPRERPPLAAMSPLTRELHNSIDEHARDEHVAWLHPTAHTIQRDLLGSPNVIAWQEAKAAFLIAGGGAWSELPHLYARYGTPAAGALITQIRALESAACALVTDTGMQALALIADVLITPGSHGILMRQLYNKTKTFFDWSAKRVGASITFVDDGDYDAIRAAITPGTTFLVTETFTNPLMRAQDIPALRALLPVGAHLVVDSTIATPWAFNSPLLSRGATIVTGSLTKALSGTDTVMGGYVATDNTDVANAIMDLLAMRGGILDEERCARVYSALATSREVHAVRCESASKIAAFLARHPAIERVFHPSRPDHPDATVIARDYTRLGSIVSFRARELDERGHRHLADVLVSTIVPRYALSFDGLTTKVNHHKVVSEYFTPPEQLARLGIDRLIRLGMGTESADDVIACLNWALHHHASITPDEIEAWRTARAASLALV
ncbi:PLP-dependent aspartate aminotransferase family protein [soil metagenome]